MKRRFFVFFVTFVSGFFALQPDTQAHPHLFLTHSLTAVFDNEGIAGFRAKWIADEFSTAGLTDGYDENENGQIDPDELSQFEKDCFKNLKGFGYFTTITVDGDPFPVSSVHDFKTSLADGKIHYTFFVPCKIKGNPTHTEITVSQYDSSYFSYLAFSETQPVSVENGNDFVIKHQIAENKNISYYFDTLHPVSLILRFKTP